MDRALGHHRVEIATAADENAISALLEASYSVLMAPAYDEAVLAQFLPVITKANTGLLASGRFFVVRERNAVTGCGGWSEERPGSRECVAGVGHVRHFAVHPEATARGIGRAIMAQCEQGARKSGAEILECYSSCNAEPFYERLGFQRVAPIVVAIGPVIRMPAVHMTKRLS
jgi:GNAT superfamily N-acetyltransferase